MGLERHSTAEVGTELGRKRVRDVKIYSCPICFLGRSGCRSSGWYTATDRVREVSRKWSVDALEMRLCGGCGSVLRH